MRIGYNIITGFEILIDLLITGHICLVGGTGSGKSYATLYLIYNLLRNYNTQLYIADFKKSGDYKGISEQFAEFDDVTTLIDTFYAEFENTPERNSQVKILLIDEYAGYMIWLTQKDKKKSEEIRGKISNILMLGRSRHCYVWCIQQRISASLFPTGIGAIDNFQICIGMGRLSVDSRKSLFANEHFDDPEFEENYHPKAGQGIVLIDGQPLQPIQVPNISNREDMHKLLIKLSVLQDSRRSP